MALSARPVAQVLEMDAQAGCNEYDSGTCSATSTPPTSAQTGWSSLESSLASVAREHEPCTVAGVVQRILRLYQELEAKPNLRPSPDVNRAFNELVSTCLDPLQDEDISAIMADTQIGKLIPRLRELCSVGEAELEQFWSSRIATNLLNKQLETAQDCKQSGPLVNRSYH